ncbi:hypothetical protein GCM10027592_63030 [Spirosoma flavus]
MKKVLIITALGLEFKAVEEYITNLVPETHPLTGSTYVLGEYQALSCKYKVMLLEAGAGNNRAADETSRALQYFNPDFLFFVGVAGGVKDVKIGDVVASSKIIGYEVGKADDNFKPRLDIMPASYFLEQLARRVKREGKWLEKIKTSVSSGNPVAYVQPIVAGEKVVISNKSEAYKIISTFCSDAIAVDMEGIGFLIAARPYGVEAIEIRGISDMLQKKEEADASGSQPEAAGNAAAFTFAMIDSIKFKPDLRDKDFQHKLLEFVISHYPQGPEQDDVWSRAGGDVSILVNSVNRKSQWRSAIQRLANGGGGKNISLNTLLAVVEEDFPNNDLMEYT